MIDIEKLRAFSIPDGRQDLTARDVAFYALSIGLGQDPLDRAQLRFVDPVADDIGVVPMMAVLMAYPGFWIGDPASGIDASKVLHAGQDLEILEPLPTTGPVTSETKLIDMVDKGAGKPALVRTETLLRDGRGAVLARHGRTMFVKDGGGFGREGGTPRQSVRAPDFPPDAAVELEVRPEQALFYRLNGDINPLHSDPDHAARAGFDRPILHGMCTAGIACHGVLRAACDYDESRLRKIDMAFTGLTYPGETLVVDVWKSGHFRVRVPNRDAVVIDRGTFTLSA